MKMWFLLTEGQVTGPFDVSEIESLIAKAKEPLIWGRGHSEWSSPLKWRKNLQSTATANSASEENLTWRIRIEGKESPPVSYTDMIKHLKTLRDYSAVDVKNSKADSWKEVYGIQEIVEALGISRRSHPRVPIMGNLHCEGKKGKFTARALSISEGGMGVNNTEGLIIGERFRASLQSPNLFINIDATCEVVYVGDDGYAGLRFIGLPIEAQSSVIEYVNKFSV